MCSQNANSSGVLNFYFLLSHRLVYVTERKRFSPNKVKNVLRSTAYSYDFLTEFQSVLL